MTLKATIDVLNIQFNVAGDKLELAEKKGIMFAFTSYVSTGIYPDIDEFSAMGGQILRVAIGMYPVKPKKQPMTEAERQKRYRNKKTNKNVTERYESNDETDENVTERYENDEETDESVTEDDEPPITRQGLIPIRQDKKEISEADILRLNEEVKRKQKNSSYRTMSALVAEATLSY